MSETLLWSIKNGEIDGVQKELNKDGVDVNADIQGRSPLHYAADYGHTQVIEYLISKGADVNKNDKHGISPLLSAIWEDHSEAVKLLLEKGADKNRKAPDGQSYIECAETDDMKKLLQ